MQDCSATLLLQTFAYFSWLVMADQHQSSHGFYIMHDEGRALKAARHACCLHMQGNLVVPQSSWFDHVTFANTAHKYLACFVHW